MAALPHAPCCYAQHHRPPVPLADPDGGVFVRRQMHVLALPRLEALGADGCDRLVSCAVKQHRRRLAGREPQIDIDRMSLVRPDALTRSRRWRTAACRWSPPSRAIISRVSAMPCAAGFLDQLVDVGPAVRVEHQPDLLRLVPQHQAHELAGLTRSWVIRLPSPSPRLRERAGVRGSHECFALVGGRPSP